MTTLKKDFVLFTRKRRTRQAAGTGAIAAAFIRKLKKGDLNGKT